MIEAIDVKPGMFSKDGLRAGDLIALANFLEFIREKENNNLLRFYVTENVLHHGPHVKQMLAFLLQHTNYFTVYCDKLLHLPVIPGTDETYPDLYNLWNMRKDVLHRKQNVFDIEDRVHIPLTSRNGNLKELTVICPLLDADYNTDRNWPKWVLDAIFKKHINKNAIIICKNNLLPDYITCDDYVGALDYIRMCTTFIGGDSGFSHFASALKNPPECHFYYPLTTYGTTFPFYWKTDRRFATSLYDPKQDASPTFLRIK